MGELGVCVYYLILAKLKKDVKGLTDEFGQISLNWLRGEIRGCPVKKRMNPPTPLVGRIRRGKP
jgi:hypothetical protein